MPEVRREALGWQNVIVIDDDLGRSGGGVARKGFERLLVAIGDGSAGAVLAIEASRLARNGRDWHTLLEFCALVGCLLIDEDGVDDPRLVNDRLLVGYERHVQRARALDPSSAFTGGVAAEGSRGDLHTSVAIGYVRSLKDRLEMDPDRRVREVVGRDFPQVRRDRQRAPGRRLAPAGGHRAPDCCLWRQTDGAWQWRLPRYNSVHRMLTNPVYAGAYVFGRTASQVRVEAGAKWSYTVFARRQEEWSVLIRDHHAGLHHVGPI